MFNLKEYKMSFLDLFKGDGRPKTDVVQINGKFLKCLYCGHDKFTTNNIALNSSLMAGLDMEFFSKQGKAYICGKCGYKHEFYGK